MLLPYANIIFLLLLAGQYRLIDVDFELDLIHRDEINVTYILQLLSRLKDEKDEGEQKKQRKAILDLVAGDAKLRSKRELIEKFINENLASIPSSENIPAHFSEFWKASYKKELDEICEVEQLEPEKVEQIIESYLFTEREPIRDDAIGALKSKPKLLQRKTIGDRVLDKLMNFIKTFIHDAPE